jgi:hypothetical protein
MTHSLMSRLADVYGAVGGEIRKLHQSNAAADDVLAEILAAVRTANVDTHHISAVDTVPTVPIQTSRVEYPVAMHVALPMATPLPPSRPWIGLSGAYNPSRGLFSKRQMNGAMTRFTI